jgi:uncharacterized protein YeaO (DUF488 family)
MIRTKRVYDPASSEDGKRILVDRLWPRGLTREKAHLDDWRKELAPSDELRKWFAHDPERYARFRARYRRELHHHREALADLVLEAENGTVTLVYAARDTTHSNATVLKELLDEMLR